jgi:hypothetical protein
MSIQGNLSAVKEGAIWGYAFDTQHQAPLTAYLYFDGVEIAHTRADIFRQGVLEQGLHPTGRCGFTFSLRELKLYLADGTRVQVKVGEERTEIISSPTQYQAPIKPQDSLADAKQVLVVGLPKSGTSILCYSIAAGLPGAHVCFEPRQEEALFDALFHYQLTQQHPNLVTKCLFIPELPNRLHLVSRLYEKKVWIYRDLRDRIISDFFFRWRRIFLEKPNADIRKIFDLLQRKEQTPASIPFHHLMTGNFAKHISLLARESIQITSKLDTSWLQLPYEKFIQGEIDDLNQYLGFRVNEQAEVSSEYQMVARSKTFGDWRRWFTPEDVEVFRPLLGPYLTHFGYDPDDWDLKFPASLPAEQGSGYIKKIVGQLLSQQGREIPAYLR